MNLFQEQKSKTPFSINVTRPQPTETSVRYVASILIPEGMGGNLQISSKIGRDSFRLLYCDENCSRIRRINVSLSALSAGGEPPPPHTLTPGIWNFWAFNDTRDRFEKVSTKFCPSSLGTGTFLLKIGPEDGKESVFYELSLMRECAKGY